jgi:hypothetical protein
VYEVHLLNTITLISFLHSPPTTITFPTNSVLILQSRFSLLIFKLIFKGVSQRMCTVGVRYSGPFKPSYYPSYHFTSHPTYFNCSTFTSHVLQYYWCSIIFFSFSFLPEFHKIVILLQTCSTSEFVCDHAWFLFMFIFWVYVPYIRENKWSLSLWVWFTSHDVLQLHPFAFKPQVIIPYGRVILHCVYVPQFLDPFISFRATRFFPKLGYYE